MLDGMSGIEISDVFGLSKPLSKLINVASAACGKVYEPLHIKKLADAKAYEIKKISEAIESTTNLASHYADGQVNVANQIPLTLEERAKNRVTFQEIQKQQNVEAVVVNAYKELENESEVSPEPVNKDWILRFFNSIEDISDKDMQELWGKVLAGEIKKPMSYSLRTLEKLRNLSKNEAFLFQKVYKNSFTIKGGDYALLRDTSVLASHQISYENLLTLSDCGLLNIANYIEYTARLSTRGAIVTANKNYTIIGTSFNNNSEIKIPVYPFTLTGNEISQIIYNTSDKITPTMLISVTDKLRNSYKNFGFHVFKIDKYFDNKRGITVGEEIY